MANLEIRLLGAFYATLDGQPTKGLDQARLQSLLAFLLLHQDQPISRQQLAYTFWPDSTEKQALNNLRTLLYRLRQTLPDADSYLALERHTVQWRLEAPFTLDVADFEEAMGHALAAEESGDRQTVRSELERSVSLYSGDLLPANYGEWVEPHRERLRQTYLTVMDKLMAVLEEDEDYTGAINYARRLLQQNPLSEATYRRLMRLQVALGDRAGALQTFEQAQKMLAEKLGVDPSPQTLELHIRTLQGEIGISSEHRQQQAQQVAQQQGKLDVQYDQLIQTNVLLIELQREREEKTKLLSRLEQAIMEAPSPLEMPGVADSGSEGETAEALCPYRGLVAYEEKDAAYFFGREALVAELTARLAGTPFLTVVGPSGSGKSSVVRAGLLPALREDGVPGSRSWKLVVLTPGAQPLATLAVTVSKLNGTTAGKIYKQLQEDPRALSLAIEQALADQPDGVRILLVVDQFEEVFALCRDEAERRMFIESLLQAVDELDGRLLAVLMVRADFYGRCAEYLDLAATQKDSILLGPLDEDGLCQVIDKPAALVNLQLEPGLADTILNDVVGEPGALPLLSHALLETWQRREARTLTLEGYRASGGIRGAIAQTADSVFYRLTPEQQAMTRRIFLRLTELGEEGAQDTRRQVAPDELVLQPQDEAVVMAVLKTLTDARLITTGEDSVEVAHEALIREWPQLRQWLEEDREGLRIHRHLTETAQAWAALDRDPGELYRGARLATASEWAEAHPNVLNPLEHEFLSASQALVRQREEEREARRQQELEAAQRLAAEEQARAGEQTEASKRLRRRAGYLTGALVAAAILALAALLLGRQANTNQQLAQNNAATAVAESEQRATAQAQAEFQEQQAHEQEAVAVAEAEQRVNAQAQAENDQQLAFSRELAAAAQANLDQDPELSIMLALEALKVQHTFGAENALHQAVVASHADQTFTEHTLEPWHVAYDAEGKRLISITENGARIWDAATGKVLLIIDGHEDVINGGNFDSRGERVVTGSFDGTARIWDAYTGEELQVFDDNMEFVFEAEFSPDGQLLATAGEGTIIWDIKTGQKLHTIPDGYFFVDFSPDGEMFATNRIDDSVGIYEVATGQELQALTTLTDFGGIGSMMFSPDGLMLATEGNDGVLRLWDLDRDSPDTFGREIMMFPGISTGNVSSSTGFSPDGKQLFSLGSDRKIRIWDIESGQEVSSFICHLGSNAVALSPDGKQVAVSVAGGEAAVKICDIGKTFERSTLTGHEDWLYNIDFSLDGNTLYTSSRDGSIKAWDISEPGASGYGDELMVFEDDAENRFYDVKLSPDGSRLAATGFDQLVHIWDAANGEELQTLEGHESGVLAVDFRPDGKQLATVGGNDWTVRIWDGQTGQELHELAHENTVWDVAYSPDGSLLASASVDATIRVWDAESGQEIMALENPMDMYAVTFDPTGRYLAGSGNEAVVNLWEVADIENGSIPEPRQLRGHDSLVTGLSFSPDGSLLASSGFDNLVRIFDVTSGQQVLNLPGHEDVVWGVTFSPDGNYLATAGRDLQARVYILDLEELKEIAQERITRPLTDSECQQYLHLDECPLE